MKTEILDVVERDVEGERKEKLPQGRVEMESRGSPGACFVICTYKEHDGRCAAVRFEHVRQTMGKQIMLEAKSRLEAVVVDGSKEREVVRACGLHFHEL